MLELSNSKSSATAGGNLWFGSWFWSVAVILLAIPSLVALKVVAEHIPNGKILVDLLNPASRQPIKVMRKKPAATPSGPAQANS